MRACAATRKSVNIYHINAFPRTKLPTVRSLLVPLSRAGTARKDEKQKCPHGMDKRNTDEVLRANGKPLHHHRMDWMRVARDPASSFHLRS